MGSEMCIRDSIVTIRLAFIGKYTKFEDLAHGDYGDYGGDY